MKHSNNQPIAKVRKPKGRYYVPAIMIRERSKFPFRDLSFSDG